MMTIFLLLTIAGKKADEVLYNAELQDVEVVAKNRSNNLKHVSSYIITYYDVCKEEQEIFNIPASIKMAQGMLESSYGRSHAATTLNAHFCIKGKNTLSKKYYDKAEKSYDSYKGYQSVWFSFRDHTNLLVGRGDYVGKDTYSWIFSQNNISWEEYSKKLNSTNEWRKKNNFKPLKKVWKWRFNKSPNYKKVAYCIHASGYATDLNYSKKLIQIIERYSLYEMDKS